jgi:hypothetical protein
MLKRWICCAAAWLLCTLLGLLSANAHDLPLDRMMNGFVKIESRQADFVVRVPLDLLLGVPFPLAGGPLQHSGVQARCRSRCQSPGERS